MKQSFLVVGDLHYKGKDDAADICTEKLLQLQQDIKPDYVVLMGDNLNDHSNTTIKAFCKITNLINRLQETSKVVLIIGNHDRETNNDYCSQYHFFTSYNSCPNVIVVDTPKVIDCFSRKIVFCPFVVQGKFDKALSKKINLKQREDSTKIALNDVVAIFGHQEVFLSGKAKGKDYWPSNRPLVILGHIHRHSTPAENIFYTGTPRQTNFGEQDDTFKRVWLFELFEDSKVFRSPTPFDLELPVYRTLSTTVENLSTIKKKNSNQYTRVIVKVEEKTDIRDPTMLKMIRRLTKKGSKVILQTEVVENKSNNDQENLETIESLVQEINDKEKRDYLLKKLK